jgi:hypothetical protein
VPRRHSWRREIFNSRCSLESEHGTLKRAPRTNHLRDNSVMHGVRTVLRALIHNRAFSTLAVAATVLGIARTTIKFSLVNGILLRPLAYGDPGRLVSVTRDPA